VCVAIPSAMATVPWTRCQTFMAVCERFRYHSNRVDQVRIMPSNWSIPKTPALIQKSGIISCRNRVIANTAVRRLRWGFWWKRFSLIVSPAPPSNLVQIKSDNQWLIIDGMFTKTCHQSLMIAVEIPSRYGMTSQNSVELCPVGLNFFYRQQFSLTIRPWLHVK